MEFEQFLADMGLKPEGRTLERQDNDGDYGPNNCCWADYRTQNKNKRSTTLYEYDGRSQTIEEWADEVGMPRSTLSERVHRYGWDIETALTAPLNHKENLPDDPEARKFVPRLNQAIAEEIREVYSREQPSYRELGRRYGVSATAISGVINNRTWRTNG
jgi:hypothetical protein